MTIAIAFFFRDPDRVVPLREGLVLAPADGRIAQIEAVMPPPELGFAAAERIRISIVLALTDVHIQRSPVAGRIARSAHMPGAFLNASLDKASEDNERRSLVIATSAGDEIAVVQIAGLIARRIVSLTGDRNSIGTGERIGLIRFGSRVDLYLPPGRTALVAVGQRAVAGETVIADLASGEPPREARQI
jgi:phosphatidylserine decarboxylase